jgi:hypothetical protein
VTMNTGQRNLNFWNHLVINQLLSVYIVSIFKYYGHMELNVTFKKVFKLIHDISCISYHHAGLQVDTSEICSSSCEHWEESVLQNTASHMCYHTFYVWIFISYHIMDLKPNECTNVDILRYRLENLCPCEKSCFLFL